MYHENAQNKESFAHGIAELNGNEPLSHRKINNFGEPR